MSAARRRELALLRKARPVHDNIAKFREREGLTKSALAKKVGVSKYAVRNWEIGASAPSSYHAPAVADALNVTIDELFSEAA
jgi:putative transcriptional regulator